MTLRLRRAAVRGRSLHDAVGTGTVASAVSEKSRHDDVTAAITAAVGGEKSQHDNVVTAAVTPPRTTPEATRLGVTSRYAATDDAKGRSPRRHKPLRHRGRRQKPLAYGVTSRGSISPIYSCVSLLLMRFFSLERFLGAFAVSSWLDFRM